MGLILVQVDTFGFSKNKEVGILTVIWDEFGGSKFLQRYNILFGFVHTTLFQQMPVCRHYCNMAATPSCTRYSSLMEDLLHCLRDCPHSKELWLLLGLGGHMNFFSLTNAIGWVKQMACGTRSLLFLPRLWQAWCWRNNRLFEEHPLQIQEVVRKTRALHDELITFCQPPGSDTSMDRILVRWKPPPKGLIKMWMTTFLKTTPI